MHSMVVKNPFQPGKEILLAYNIGCLFDLYSGRYMFGEHGEAIMNGGLTTISGIMGPGNSYKSTTMDFQNLSVLNRYEQSHYAIYDAEGT